VIINPVDSAPGEKTKVPRTERTALPRSLLTTSQRSGLHRGNGSNVPRARRTRCPFNMWRKATIGVIASALLDARFSGSALCSSACPAATT